MFAILTYNKEYGKHVSILDIIEEKIYITNTLKIEDDINFFDITKTNQFCDVTWWENSSDIILHMIDRSEENYNDSIKFKKGKLIKCKIRFNRKENYHVFNEYFNFVGNCFSSIGISYEEYDYNCKYYNWDAYVSGGIDFIGNYGLFVFYNKLNMYTHLFVIEVNKDAIIKNFVFEYNFQSLKHSYYSEGDKLYFALSICDYNIGYSEYVKVISIDCYGNISEFNVENSCADKNLKYINTNLHGKYIIYSDSETGLICIYDYVNKKKIGKSNIDQNFEIIGFVKLFDDVENIRTDYARDYTYKSNYHDYVCDHNYESNYNDLHNENEVSKNNNVDINCENNKILENIDDNLKKFSNSNSTYDNNGMTYNSYSNDEFSDNNSHHSYENDDYLDSDYEYVDDYHCEIMWNDNKNIIDEFMNEELVQYFPRVFISLIENKYAKDIDIDTNEYYNLKMRIYNMKILFIEMYNKDLSKDLIIETNNGSVMAHEKILCYICLYFKNILSNVTGDIKKIKINCGIEEMKLLLDCIYKFELHISTINELLALYELCDMIKFNHFYLLKKLNYLVKKKFCINDIKSCVTIHNIKFLKNIPKSIKVITFTEAFNECIDGLIDVDVEVLSFGKSFKKDINIIPKSVKKIIVPYIFKGFISDEILQSVELIQCNEIILKY